MMYDEFFVCSNCMTVYTARYDDNKIHNPRRNLCQVCGVYWANRHEYTCYYLTSIESDIDIAGRFAFMPGKEPEIVPFMSCEDDLND